MYNIYIYSTAYIYSTPSSTYVSMRQRSKSPANVCCRTLTYADGCICQHPSAYAPTGVSG